MATSAFKSTTKRTSIGTTPTANDSGSSNRTGTHRRSRSVSRFSHRLPAEVGYDETPAPKAKFVNTVRGSGFPEISLDDLAIKFFDSVDRGRSSEVNTATPAGESNRRGRSVSRHSSRVVDGKASATNNSGGGRVLPDSNSRRKRSVSVARYHISDSSESDLDHPRNSRSNISVMTSNCGNSQVPSLQKPTASNHRRLGRSLSQTNLLRSHDDYSSQSSALTDEEVRDACSSKSGIERTIRAVYAQKKTEHPTGDEVNSGLYEAMRNELRHAVEEIRIDIEQAMEKTKKSVPRNDCLESNNTVSSIRKSYGTQLEQSEKRKQDLLAEIVLEDQRGKELSKIVKELLPDPKNNTVLEKPSRARKRSNDKSRMSKQLTEEAEKYLEDFISNVEDTDISSFDGERSDSSSTLGGIIKPKNRLRETESFQTPARSNSSVPVEMDGVVLPWLQWETDSSPLLCKNKVEAPVTPKTILWDAAQDLTTAHTAHSISSRGSWSPGVDGPSMTAVEDSGRKYVGVRSYQSQSNSGEQRKLRFEMEEYGKLQKNEELLFERWRQRQRINTGGLLLCNEIFF